MLLNELIDKFSKIHEEEYIDDGVFISIKRYPIVSIKKIIVETGEVYIAFIPYYTDDEDEELPNSIKYSDLFSLLYDMRKNDINNNYKVCVSSLYNDKVLISDYYVSSFHYGEMLSDISFDYFVNDNKAIEDSNILYVLGDDEKVEKYFKYNIENII